MTDSLLERLRSAIGTQYRIDDEIGRGGMSVVYRAFDPRLNRAVAIKVLPPELAHDAAVRSRFTREAQTSAQLSHPHIVPIFDVGEREGIAYFVMSLITGGNLASLLEQHPLRPVDEVKRVLAEVADALAYAHLRGVIHRDIKPDNILLDADTRRAIVTDFGIARAMEGGARLTQTGIAVGTPTYMSPEQAVGDGDIDGRSDIYSLGVVGYQMLAGRVPFSAGNSMALLLKHVSEQPRAILDVRPDTPKALAQTVERALAKTPETRWSTATAFRDALLVGDGAAWRSDSRLPVRYPSPIPRGPRSVQAADVPALPGIAGLAPTSSGELVLVPSHLAGLTPAQRDDLRLWSGRIHLLDRVKLTRRLALFTVAMSGLAMAGVVVGFGEGVPPLVLAPIVPFLMARRLSARTRALRAAGLKARWVFLRLRAKSVLPPGLTPPSKRQLEKLAPRHLLDSPHGAAVRRAAEDRASIIDIVASLSKADRAMLPDIRPTVDALFERVVSVAEALRRLDTDFDAGEFAQLNARIAGARAGLDSPEEDRRLALLQRQREALDDLAQRRALLTRQLDSAALALGNLRLDLIKLRSSGIQSSLGDVSTATREARVLSREIASALAIADELREL